MGPFTAEIVGEVELANAWGGACTILRQRTARGVGLAVKEGADEIKRGHTFKNRTRELEKSVVGFVEGWLGDRFVGVIRAGAKHASHVEYDTKPHEIHGNPFLTFKWKGVWVSFRYVRHPGTKGQPFMHLGYYKAERVIIRELEKGVEAMQNFLGR